MNSEARLSYLRLCAEETPLLYELTDSVIYADNVRFKQSAECQDRTASPIRHHFKNPCAQ